MGRKWAMKLLKSELRCKLLRRNFLLRNCADRLFENNLVSPIMSKGYMVFVDARGTIDECSFMQFILNTSGVLHGKDGIGWNQLN